LLPVLAQIASIAQDQLLLIALVFTRIGATVALLPGLGEQTLSVRIRLGITVAITALVWPMLIPSQLGNFTLWETMPLIVLEGLVGVFLGLSVRLILMALQFAGSIASMSTSLSQIMGSAGTPDPLPSIGNILALAGITLALATGLHIKAVLMITYSYDVLKIGMVPSGEDIVYWGINRSASAFALGFTLAGPFVIASFAYNLTLGLINRAMPQLMVAFIGAPAITAGGILILFLAAPLIILLFNDRLDTVFQNPFGVTP